MSNPLRHIASWLCQLSRVWADEMRNVFSDVGVMIFFFLLPLAYPIVYTLIYNPEVADNIPVAIVDNCRTARSRELVRMIDATQAINTIGYAADMGEARRWMDSHDCVAIIEIPRDYDQKIGRGDQAVIPFYCDMSLLLRYRNILLAMSDVQLQLGNDIRAELIDRTGELGQMALGSSKTVAVDAYFMGDTSQGFASFVMPGIFVLILQQSLVLGVAMLAGGRSYRRRHGIDPLAPTVDRLPQTLTGVNALHGVCPSATVLGRLLCYLTCYAPMVVYMFAVVPWLFSIPSMGSLGQYIVYILPMMIAGALFGMVLSVFVTERESSMLVIVFTSVLFLFLSGLLWPRYAMPDVWVWLGDLIPSTWGIEGFVRMASDGATIEQQSGPYKWMWLLAAVYFLVAYIIARYHRPACKTTD